MSLVDVTCRGTSLGMEDSTVSGGGILASSWYSPYIPFAPFQGRLNNLKGSWCANKPEKDRNPYLQVREQTRFWTCRRAGNVLYFIVSKGIFVVVVGDFHDKQDTEINGVS